LKQNRAVNKGPLIIGHRGASAHAPENTHAAFVRAFEAGADGIEFDVRLARDGVPYVFHDATLERTAGVLAEADAHSSTTLSEIEVGEWFNRRYPLRSRESYALEKIPMLAQVFARYGSHTLYAEMKCEDAARRPALARAVVEMIQDYGIIDKVVVKSFALDSLREVKRLAPEIRTAALFGRSWPRPLVSTSYIIGAAADCGADEISLHHSLLRTATVEAAHRLGLDVLVWTVNSTAFLRRALKLNLRAVFTDYPRQMRASLTKLRAEQAARGKTG
jgi:glycerophosphoryl diester phosphodiesterase